MSGPSSATFSFSGIVRNFAPGWFASVIGTGVLAMTTHTLSAQCSFLAPVALGLHYFNVLLFVLWSTS